MPPTPPDLHVLSVVSDTTAPQHLERIAWLTETLSTAPIELSRPKESRIVLECYFEDEIDAHVAGHAFFNATGHSQWSVRPCPAEDWTTFWKKHFPPLDIGKTFRVCPPWETDAANPDDREVIVINPGMSFGTGNHFTTRFCLEAVERLLGEFDSPSVLDAGTGSGLLSIAAKRRGASRVLAVDNDATALEYAAENLRLNDITEGADGVELRVVDLTTERIDETFDLVFANLYGHLLITIADDLAALPTQRLALSGIRTVEGDLVAQRFAEVGWLETGRDADPEWCGMILKGEQQP